MKSLVLAVTLVFATTSLAAAQGRPFDPRAYQSRHIGQPSQILVIGTPHLSGAPDTFDPAVLEPLLARLAAFRPDAIAIEALPGRSIAQMWDYRQAYPDVARSYGARAMTLSGLARPGVNMDMPEAEAEVRRTLSQWPDSPTPEQRRRLAALFAAAGDPTSALVQWWRLTPSERVADDAVPRLLAEQFTAYDAPARRNENHLIAARLASRLGLERVYPMDDQSDNVGPEFSGAFETDIEAFMGEPWLQALLESEPFKPLMEAPQHLTTPEQAIATYRMLNGNLAASTPMASGSI